MGKKQARSPWADMSAESLDVEHDEEVAAAAQAEECEKRAETASAAGSEET